MPPWLGCEFVFVPIPKRILVQDNPGLLNRAEAVFAPANPLHLFYSLDGESVNDSSELLRIRAGLTQRDKGITWWDLSELQLRQRLPNALDGQDWQDRLVGLRGLAVRAATERLSVDLAPKVVFETSRILEMRMAAERDVAQDEVEKLDVLVQAITQWDVMLDSVGLFSINGSLHHASR
jgi:hypothetical protein